MTDRQPSAHDIVIHEAMFKPVAGGKVLVADDNKDGVAIMLALLEDEGFETKAAHTGEDALKLVDSFEPDIVILDVRMPGKDGMQVLRQIRSNPLTAEIPVIMVTAMSDTQDIVYGLELGANDYIPKPPQIEILVARIRTQLKIKSLQDQRREIMDQLEHLDMLKDRFLSIAAHDLKNPLNNLTFAVSLMQVYREQIKEDDQGEYDELLTTMQNSVNTMLTIITDYLDLQALRAGQFTLEPESMDLNALVTEVIHEFAVQAESKSVTLAPDLAEDLPNLWADPSRIRQVVTNLISNAIKFSPRETEVRVHTTQNDDSVRFEVIDKGPGIPDKDREQLFEEFARLSNKPTGGEKSSGVGLSIARRMVELHGGEIGVDTKVGKGSTFWVNLPISAPSDDSDS